MSTIDAAAPHEYLAEVDAPFTPCPSWCTSTDHDLGDNRDGLAQVNHTGPTVSTGAGPAAWVSRIDTHEADGSITIGEITVGADLECAPTIDPETAGAMAALLFTMGMRVKRLRAGEPADVG